MPVQAATAFFMSPTCTLKHMARGTKESKRILFITHEKKQKQNKIHVHVLVLYNDIVCTVCHFHVHMYNQLSSSPVRTADLLNLSNSKPKWKYM